MGLDMYLKKNTYVGAEYEHNEITGTIELFKAGKKLPIDLKKVSEITESVGYWRKANQIHAWFVKNVQKGVDECKEHEVSAEQLIELRDLCSKALETKDASILPPQQGFFFGTTLIDEWYWKDLEHTIEIIKALDLDTGEYYYRSSW